MKEFCQISISCSLPSESISLCITEQENTSVGHVVRSPALHCYPQRETACLQTLTFPLSYLQIQQILISGRGRLILVGTLLVLLLCAHLFLEDEKVPIGHLVPAGSMCATQEDM